MAFDYNEDEDETLGVPMTTGRGDGLLTEAERDELRDYVIQGRFIAVWRVVERILDERAHLAAAPDHNTGLRERLDAWSQCVVGWRDGGDCFTNDAERCTHCAVRADIRGLLASTPPPTPED